MVQIIDKKLSYQTILFAVSRPIWMIWIKYFFLGCPFCNRPVHPDDLEKMMLMLMLKADLCADCASSHQD